MEIYMYGSLSLRILFDVSMKFKILGVSRKKVFDLTLNRAYCWRTPKAWTNDEQTHQRLLVGLGTEHTVVSSEEAFALQRLSSNLLPEVLFSQSCENTPSSTIMIKMKKKNF